MKVYSIYRLKRNGEVFYIGVTFNPQSRFAAHKCRFGRNISFEVIRRCNDKNKAYRIESKTIKKYLDAGYELRNGDSTNGHNVRVDKSLLNKVKEYCQSERMTLSGFYDKAAERYLAHCKQLQSETIKA